MRTPLSLLLLGALATGCATGRGAATAQPETPPPAAPQAEAPRAEAKPKTFSMRTYYMAFLRRGPAWSAERTAEAVAAGQGHMAHIKRMAHCGKLVLAGPFDAGPDAPKDALAGIFIFDVASREEALALTQHDPAVKAGRFTIEVLPWYGPAGLSYDGQEPPDRSASCTP
jgi:uncharacterized protein YciI